MATKRDLIIEKAYEIEALPTAAVESMRLLLDPNVEINKLISTLEYDPALTSNTLKLANSAVYGATRPMATIREAVTRLGIHKIFKLVMATVIGPMAKQPIKGYGMESGALWNHSMRVAIGVLNTAKALNLELPNYAFTTGLLVDIGKIALGSALEIDEFVVKEMVYTQGVSFDEAERIVLGIDHAELGAILLEHWNLPEEIIEPVRWHHQPDEIDEPSLLTDCIHIADSISLLSAASGTEGLNYYVSQNVFERLNMKHETPEIIMCHTQAELNRLNMAS